MREPDLNAPRHRYKYETALKYDLLDKFKKKYPQYSGYSNKVLMKAIKEHNKLIWKTVINERDGVDLQGNNGHIFIAMTPPFKNKPIAYKESMKLGTTVYYNNHQTDNRTIKICYTNYRTRLKFSNKQLWEFTAVRQFSTTASKECPSKWTMYHHKDPNKQIWELLDKRLFKDKAKKRQEKALSVYNEFDME